MMRRPYTALDLFAGCGGLSLGMKKNGFKIVYANEKNSDAALTYTKNFPNVHVDIQDIRKINPAYLAKQINRKKVDVIAAGPPCQGFSTLSRRTENDPRNKMVRNLIKFVHVFKPKIIVIENVMGLLSMNDGRTIKRIVKEFENMSYHVTVRHLLACDFGVPQQRKRVFIIGTKKFIPPDELFPIKNGHAIVSVREAISDLSFLGINESSKTYKYKPRSQYQKWLKGEKKILFNHESPNHSTKIQKRFASMPVGSYGKKLKHFDTAKRDCYKLDPSKPSLTVNTLPEDLVHYKKNRIPTVRELARLQSFPDSFVFHGPRTAGGRQRKYSCPQYTQVGNAVPPILSQQVFKKIKKVLKKYY